MEVGQSLGDSLYPCCSSHQPAVHDNHPHGEATDSELKLLSAYKCSNGAVTDFDFKVSCAGCSPKTCPGGAGGVGYRRTDSRLDLQVSGPMILPWGTASDSDRSHLHTPTIGYSAVIDTAIDTDSNHLYTASIYEFDTDSKSDSSHLYSHLSGCFDGRGHIGGHNVTGALPHNACATAPVESTFFPRCKPKFTCLGMHAEVAATTPTRLGHYTSTDSLHNSIIGYSAVCDFDSSHLHTPTIGHNADTDSGIDSSHFYIPTIGHLAVNNNDSSHLYAPNIAYSWVDSDSDFQQVSYSSFTGDIELNTQEVSGPRRTFSSTRRSLGALQVYLYLTLLMVSLHTAYGNGGLIGTDQPCSLPDGAPFYVEGISTLPCFSCFCQGGKVECTRAECTTRGPCPFIPRAKLKQQCCHCQGCLHKGEFHESGSTWTDAKKSCKQYTCEAGVVTGYKVECHVVCKYPVFPSGNCCPVCEGCSVNGMTYRNHDTFTSPTDPSATCTCKDGSVSCERRACPVLNCRHSAQISQSAPGSCPQCKRSRRLFKPKKGCFFRNGVLRERERVTPEPCTNCVCTNNTVVCVRRVCPVLHCGMDDVIKDQSDCCPRCKRKKKPCRLRGKTYKHGATWWPDECTSCDCDDNTVRCHVQQCQNKFSCPKGQRLTHTQGKCCPVCVDSGAVCAVFGDPHYRTFDGLIYNFQGTCRYVLAQDCHMGNFSIRVRNAVRMTNDFAWTKSVSIVLQDDLRISLHQNLRVKVNGKPTTLPYDKPQVAAVVKGGRSVTLKTTFGLKVIWDGDSYLEVTVPPNMKNKMCGLCGNYNGIQGDDFTGKHGGLYFDANDFAETWRLGKGRTCGKKFRSPHKVLRQQSLCDNNVRKRRRAERECSVLHSSPFTRCGVKVDVGPYYMSCVMDVCGCPPGRQCSCETLTAYSKQCTREGVPVSWKPPKTCRANQCPKGAVFNVCASACPRTCANLDEPTSCDKPCVPACQCPHGTVLKGKRCVHRDKCSKRTWGEKVFGLLSRS